MPFLFYNIINKGVDYMNKFTKFYNEYKNKDCKAIVESLLREGKMSQQQFDNLSKQANEMAKLTNLFR